MPHVPQFMSVGVHRHVVLSGLLLIILLAGCQAEVIDSNDQAGITDDSILIGSSSALGGHTSFLGTQYTLGSRIWFNEINERGGVHGREIQLLSYDDEYDPPLTIQNTETLVSVDEVFMLFGYVGTPTSVRIIETVQENKIPSFGFFTGAEALRTPFRPYMFHVRASYYAEAEGAVAYFVDHLGLDRIGVMYQNDAFGSAVLAGVQLAAQRRDLELVETDTYERGSMDVESAVKSLRSSDADAVVLVGTYSPLAKYIQLSHQAEFRPYFHTVSFIGSEAFAKELVDRSIQRSEYEKIVVTQVVPSPESENLFAVGQYRELLEKHFPDERPNYVSLEGFINAKILTEALERVGPTLSRSSLIRELEAFEELEAGIGKRISFGARDHSGLDDVFYSHLDESGSFSTFELDP